MSSVRGCTVLSRRVLPRALITTIMVAGGCALNRMGEEEVSAALERNTQSAAQTAEDYARRPVPSKPTTAPAADTERAPATPATLREFILLALAENPEIKVAQETARMQAARIPQVTALPDPMLTTRTLPEPVRTAEGDNYFTLGVQQRFPVPEKLDRAGRIALQEVRMALDALQRTRLNVIAEVKRTYFRIYIIDRTVEVDLTNQDLLRGLIDAARAQVASGRRRQDDVLRAQVEFYNLESQLIELRQQRETMVAMLNRLLNRPPGTPIATLEEFDLRSVDRTLEELLSAAAERNPDLQRLREQIERDQQAVELARLAYWPDFTVGFEWMLMEPRDAFRPPPNAMTGQRPVVSEMSEDGTDNWGIIFGFNVPIWFEKIEAGIAESRRRLASSQQQYAATLNRVDFQVTDALERVRAQQSLAEIFKDTIIPQARQAYEVSRSAYSTGAGDFLFVVDNWQKWLVFTIQYHRALGELERSVADLEEAIGRSLDEAGGES